ncbi:MAG: hypothetical protein ACFFGZ_11400 [Candidatus Thorarchaeota archaeon]
MTASTEESKPLELQMYSLARRIADIQMKLKELLAQYDVQSPDEIESKIYDHKIPEHPSYEDYLSALSYQQSALELVELLDAKVKELRKECQF